MPVKILIAIVAGLVLQASAALAASAKTPPKNTSTMGTERTAVPTRLKPGEYLWVPEASPRGPIVMVVSLPEQLAYVYRNGVIIGASTISSGKKGHETPTGVFTILQKNADHYSNVYNNAPMPYMQRLTWRGVAIHAGRLPGYPASHGCVRMPYEFAQKLFAETKTGLTVVVSNEQQFPANVAHPGLVAPVDVAGAAVTSAPTMGGLDWRPETAPEGPVTILVTNEDKRVRVFRNGVEIGNAPFTLTDPNRKITLHVLTLLEPSVGAALDPVTGRPVRHWLVVSGGNADTVSTGQLLTLFKISSAFLNNLATVVVPGTTLVITQPPASPSANTTVTNNVVAVATEDPSEK
jgi:hypothetical protein